MQTTSDMVPPRQGEIILNGNRLSHSVRLVPSTTIIRSGSELGCVQTLVHRNTIGLPKICSTGYSNVTSPACVKIIARCWDYATASTAFSSIEANFEPRFEKGTKMLSYNGLLRRSQVFVFNQMAHLKLTEAQPDASSRREIVRPYWKWAASGTRERLWMRR